VEPPPSQGPAYEGVLCWDSATSVYPNKSVLDRSRLKSRILDPKSGSGNRAAVPTHSGETKVPGPRLDLAGLIGDGPANVDMGNYAPRSKLATAVKTKTSRRSC
jgi:hypothetical protein